MVRLASRYRRNFGYRYGGTDGVHSILKVRNARKKAEYVTSDSGRTIASGSMDGTILLWDMSLVERWKYRFRYTEIALLTSLHYLRLYCHRKLGPPSKPRLSCNNNHT